VKITLADPRPHYAFAEVIGIGQDSGWGNPSGHATVMAVTSYFIYLYHKRNNGAPTAFLCLFGLELIAIDRVYLGVHFYSQILVGWALAFCWVTLEDVVFAFL
jgi:undecaprenyl-diphosphatase